MSSPADSENTAALTPGVRVAACLQQLAHLLPAQAPLRDFVHHNTLHAFQHLPFAEALSEAARLTGARPWLAEERCRELFRQGRVNSHDLAFALRQLPELHADDPLSASAEFAPFGLCRGEVLQVALLYPSAGISSVRLRWHADEARAFERFPADLDVAARQRLLAAGGDEAAVVADLWAAARTLCASAGADACAATVATPCWPELLGRLGQAWTLGELFARLCGEDFRQPLQASLIRHLAAHLDQGLSAWKNPAQTQGFYAAWRESASHDWAWELDEFAGARQEIKQLPDDPLQLIADELRQLDVDESSWFAYLQRLAMELPGWAGMFHWREAHSRADDPPVSLTDFLAVRVLLERLYAEQLARRVWGRPLGELADHFSSHPAELTVRCAVGSRQWSDEILDLVLPRLSAGGAGNGWPLLAGKLDEARQVDAAATDHVALAAWPLFLLAQRLGIAGCELRAIASTGAQTLLACANSLTDQQRGLVWLLAYEHHYRQQLLAALRANHGRAQALAGAAVAQLVFCMDDREEGTRRHLEEVNPAYETFGAAGFFGVPMLWQGIDDERPTALCPIVVRPENAVCENPSLGSEAAYRQHQQRRKLRLRARECLHQGSRRGWLQASLLTVGAAPAALLGLVARTLAPGRLGALLDRYRDAFDKPLAGDLTLTAAAAEATRLVSADAPRLGFSEEEQVACVGGFLRSIGLTRDFAPLVLIVGHGSDSRNNPHLAAYDCGACSGRHGGPNSRVFAALANRPEVRQQLAAQGIVIAERTYFISAEHNTCDERFVWYDEEQLPASHRDAFACLRRDCAAAARLHAVERCRRFASAPHQPSPRQASQHLADRRQDIAQARPELGHATIAAAFIGRRAMSRGAFFDRRVFLISYDPLPDADGRILEATLLAAGPVGAGINLEYYFSTVNNEGFGCGSKIMHNLAGLFGVMQGASSDLRTGLPLQMVEIHEPMRLLVVVEQTSEIIATIYQRQPPLQELIGNGWIILASKHPQTGEIALFDARSGWQRWSEASDSQATAAVPEVQRSFDWFAGQREPLPPALLRTPVMRP